MDSKLLCSITHRELADGSVEDNNLNKKSQLTLALRVQTGMKVCVNRQFKSLLIFFCQPCGCTEYFIMA